MSVAVTQHKNYIGGEWVDSAGGETMEVINPATGETIAEVPASTAEDADRAVQAAKRALPECLETTPGGQGFDDNIAYAPAQFRVVLGQSRQNVRRQLPVVCPRFEDLPGTRPVARPGDELERQQFSE